MSNSFMVCISDAFNMACFISQLFI